MSQDYHDLFQRSSVFDQLNFFQSLLDSRDLSADQALALLNAIRPELETPQVNKSTAYRRYGQIMESLHRDMPEVYDQIVNAWKTKRGIVEVEETPHARLVRERLRTESPQENSDFWNEAQREPQKPAGEIHVVDHLRETKIESPIEIGEGAEETEEHGEPEEAEEHEEEESEAESEKEGEEPEEREEETEETEDENERAEKEEEQEEEPEEKEETEDEEQEAKESEEEPEKEETKTEESEKEEAEPEEASEEHESEREEETATETEGSDSEAEAQEESDHMISEAAEAAAESEHVSMEIEPEEIEPEGEEEPPMEAGE